MRGTQTFWLSERPTDAPGILKEMKKDERSESKGHIKDARHDDATLTPSHPISAAARPLFLMAK